MSMFTSKQVQLSSDDTDADREGIIRGLCIFLSEDSDDLVQEYMGLTEAYTLSAIEGTTVGIYVAREPSSSDYSDVRVNLKGVVVLHDLDNVALASAIPFGLFYTINLRYPPRLLHAFKIFQKNNNGVRCSSTSKKGP